MTERFLLQIHTEYPEEVMKEIQKMVAKNKKIMGHWTLEQYPSGDKHGG